MAEKSPEKKDYSFLREAKERHKARKRRNAEIARANLKSKRERLAETIAEATENAGENVGNRTIRRTVDLNLLIEELKNGCKKCKRSPLLLTNANPFSSSSNRLEVICQKCRTDNYVALHSEEVEENSIHTGQVYSREELVEAFSSIVDVPCMAEENLKNLDNKGEAAIEETALQNCGKKLEDEKKQEFSLLLN